MKIETIPHDFEGEQAVLGTLIKDNDKIPLVLNILDFDDFHTEAHRYIYQCIKELETNVDEITIGDRLKSYSKLEEIGGYIYLAELIECSPSTGNVEYYAKILKDHSMMRQLIKISLNIGRKARDPQQSVKDLLIEVDNKLSDIVRKTLQNKLKHIKYVLQENFQELENLSKNKNELIGLPTGYIDLDKITSGLLDTDVIYIAARPSMGKTALAMNIVDYYHKVKATKGATLIFSREMANTQLSKRILASHAKINTRRLKTGNLNEEDWDKLAQATDELSDAEIYFDEETKNIDQVRYEVKSFSRTKQVTCVVLDYLQLFEGEGKNREQEISYISRKIKDIAKDMKIPIVVLSQLNRSLEKRTDKTPILSDLRESGSIEQDADIILFIYRDEVYNEDTEKQGIADIIIAKHRNGPLGLVQLQFIGKYTKFVNLARR